MELINSYTTTKRKAKVSEIQQSINEAAIQAALVAKENNEDVFNAMELAIVDLISNQYKDFSIRDILLENHEKGFKLSYSLESELWQI
jgi:hypothetical protein